MGFLESLIAVLTLLAGIGIFLVACRLMSTNLEAAGSSRLKTLFARVSDNKMFGVGIGALGTAAIQSSGATTVMIIGFVNVGIMSLQQAATVIYGANIGTTITAQIVALGLLGGTGISATTIFASLTGLGAFITLMAKNEKPKIIGNTLTGFGMLFVGLDIMANSMSLIAQNDAVKLSIAHVNSAFLLVLIGIILTAIVQSSSIITSVTITMLVSGLINLNQGIYITLGSNIGSCVVAIIAGITSGINAKRTALIHLFFNCFGVAVFLCVALLLYLTTQGQLNFGVIFQQLFPNTPQFQLAMFHTIFNCSTVLIIIPLTNVLVKLVCAIVPDATDKTDATTPHFYFIDETMLRTPVVAVNQVKLEIEHMSQLAMRNYERSIHMVTNLDFSSLSDFQVDEAELNFLNHELIQYIIRLNSTNIPIDDHKFLTNSIRTVSDLERIGDYAENITEYAEILDKTQEHFSQDEITEIEQMRDLIFNVYQNIMKAYMENDKQAYWTAHSWEDKVDDLHETMEQKHIERMVSGESSPNVGAQYIELASNSERISDHLINVGKTLSGLYPS